MKKLIIAALALTPALASAQQGNLGNITSLVDALGRIVDSAIPIAFALILLAFFWGLVKFIMAAGNEEAKADAKKIMGWGIVALFIAASIWGIVIFVRGSLGIGGDQDIQAPGVIR